MSAIAKELERQLEALRQAQAVKLRQQRDLASRYNELLTREGGMIDQTRLTCKNLEYAIAIAMQPGPIAYYQPPEEVRNLISSGELKTLVKEIAALQQELDEMRHEIERLRATIAQQSTPPAGADETDETGAVHGVACLADWFARYGRPAAAPPAGFTTTFAKSDKVYGGTAQHPAFRSQASKMQRGRITR